MNNTETKNPPMEAGLQVELAAQRPANNAGEKPCIPGVSDDTVRCLISRGLLHLSRDRSDLMISRMEIEPFLGKTTKKSMNEKPTHEVRLGAIKAAVWRNKTETSGTRFNVKFSRIYKDGDAWKSTESFGRDDLLLLSKVADQTHSWIHQQEQWESGSKKPPVETNATPPAQ